jgi:hypothetical protein
LPVCSGLDEPSLTRLPHHCQELDGALAALPFERKWRHIEQHVLRKQTDDTVHVARLEGAGEALDKFALSNGRRGRRLAVFGRYPPLQSGPGAFERARNRLFARVEDLRDLIGPIPQDVTKNVDRALSRWQSLHCRHERERNRFSCLIEDVRARSGIWNPVEECIGIRLEPHDLPDSRRFEQVSGAR